MKKVLSLHRIMKKAIYILIFLLAVSACTFKADRTVCALLQKAEGMMRLAPDSACRILQSLKAEDLESPENYDYYYLLGMEWRMTERLPIGDTASIRQIVENYLSKKDVRMLARAYRLMGYAKQDKKQAIVHYRSAMKYAGEAKDKSLLADIYRQSSQAHYIKGREDFGIYYFMKTSDTLYHAAKRMAEEAKDTLLLIETLRTGSWLMHSEGRVKSAEKALLTALHLAEAIHNRRQEAKITLELSNLYEVTGQKDLADDYQRKSLSLKEDGQPLSFTPIKLTFEEPKRLSPFIPLLVTILAAGIYGFLRLRKQHRQKVALMQQELDALVCETPSVLDKIDRIIKDYLHQDRSDLQMQEADWKQLLWETDKRWGNITEKIRKEYHLNDTEIRLFCLHLTEIPMTHLPYLFGRTRSTIYNKNRELMSKLGLERTSSLTFKEEFKVFAEKQNCR